jgi:hypothetical protein
LKFNTDDIWGGPGWYTDGWANGGDLVFRKLAATTEAEATAEAFDGHLRPPYYFGTREELDKFLACVALMSYRK